MRAESHPPVAVLAAALLGSLAALVAVEREAIERVPDLWDAAGRPSVGAPAVRTIGTGLTVMGGGTGLLVLVGIVVALLLRARRIHGAILVFVAIIGAEVIDRVFKRVIDRPRPPTAEAAKLAFGNGYERLVLLGVVVALLLAWPTRWRPFALVASGAFFAVFALDLLAEAALPIHPGFDSFPSGHAVGSMALAGSVVAVTRRTRWRWVAVVGCAAFTFVVGASRVWLGFHHPSDVIGGWCLGLAWVAACWLILSGAAPVVRRLNHPHDRQPGGALARDLPRLSSGPTRGG